MDIKKTIEYLEIIDLYCMSATNLLKDSKDDDSNQDAAISYINKIKKNIESIEENL